MTLSKREQLIELYTKMAMEGYQATDVADRPV